MSIDTRSEFSLTPVTIAGLFIALGGPILASLVIVPALGDDGARSPLTPFNSANRVRRRAMCSGTSSIMAVSLFFLHYN